MISQIHLQTKFTVFILNEIYSATFVDDLDPLGLLNAI